MSAENIEQTPVTTSETPAADAAPPAEAPKPAPVKVATPISQPSAPATERPAPPQEPKPNAPDAVALALKSLQSDNAALAKDLEKATRKATEAEREVTSLRAQVETFTRRDREGAIVAKIREAAPHRSDLEVRGILTALAEQGAVDRFSEKADEQAAKALEVLKTAAPDFLRAPARQPAGGPGGAPPQNAGRAYKSPM